MPLLGDEDKKKLGLYALGNREYFQHKLQEAQERERIEIEVATVYHSYTGRKIIICLASVANYSWLNHAVLIHKWRVCYLWLISVYIGIYVVMKLLCMLHACMHCTFTTTSLEFSGWL